MKIGKFDTNEKVLVVAEIGNNHEGSLARAQEMVRKAAECGVDAVKFQTFRTEHYVNASDAARFKRLKSFELGPAKLRTLAELARSLGLLFLSTPFDLGSAEFLTSIVDAYKIASADNDFYPLISQVVQTGKPVIISTGLSDTQHIERTVSFVKQEWATQGIAGQLALLHCVCSYPVPAEQANLRSISFLAEKLECTVGYSDHLVGINGAVLAVALGARIIEKHFTLDKNLSDFRDHQLSADPAEMQALVQRIKETLPMLGTHAKNIQPVEQGMVPLVRRSIVAAADLAAGHQIGPSDLTWIRPAGGLAPGQERLLLGRKLKRAVHFGERLSASDLE